MIEHNYSCKIFNSDDHSLGNCVRKMVFICYSTVFQCPVCGNNLKCSHSHASSCHTPSPDVDSTTSSSFSLPSQRTSSSIAELSSDEVDYHEGSAGRTPEVEETKTTSSSSESSTQLPLTFWFGPLVLASFAMVGLAFQIFQGDIGKSRFKNVTSRVMAAVQIVSQATHSVFGFINIQT